MEDLINRLINSNLKLVSKDTGIPYDRMYKWVKGKATPKTNDYSTLVKYFNEIELKVGKTSNTEAVLSQNSNITNKENATNEEKGREMQDLDQFSPDNHGQAAKDKDVHGGAIPTANKDNKGVPYYDIDFMGGFDLIFNDQQIQPSFYIDFLPFNDCDCWINVTGKSMGPLIAHGDIVGLKKVDNWKRFLLEGEIYAVITDNGFRTIKIIGAGHDKDHFTLIPYNKSDEHKPQTIPKEVITHIFRVKGNIKKFF